MAGVLQKPTAADILRAGENLSSRRGDGHLQITEAERTAIDARLKRRGLQLPGRGDKPLQEAERMERFTSLRERMDLSIDALNNLMGYAKGTRRGKEMNGPTFCSAVLAMAELFRVVAERDWTEAVDALPWRMPLDIEFVPVFGDNGEIIDEIEGGVVLYGDKYDVCELGIPDNWRLAADPALVARVDAHAWWRFSDADSAAERAAYIAFEVLSGRSEDQRIEDAQAAVLVAEATRLLCNMEHGHLRCAVEVLKAIGSTPAAVWVAGASQMGDLPTMEAGAARSLDAAARMLKAMDKTPGLM